MASKSTPAESYFVNQVKDVNGEFHDYDVTKDGDLAMTTHKLMSKHFPHYEPRLVTTTDADYGKNMTVAAQEGRNTNFKKVSSALDSKKATAKPAAKKPAAKAAAKPAAKAAAPKKAAPKKTK
jgi:hypothetical protein